MIILRYFLMFYASFKISSFIYELTFIKPYFWNEDIEKYNIWEKTMKFVEKSYMDLIALGAKPQEARSVLPNSLKTEIVVTMNLREWRHFFKLRAAKAAHPQMRQITVPLLEAFRDAIPVLFDDLVTD